MLAYKSDACFYAVLPIPIRSVVAELRAAVRSELGYSCSAGVAHNKVLAKLVSDHLKLASDSA